MAGELPFEGGGGLLVAPLEGGQAVFDVVEIGEVVGGEDLALDDGVVDLDLVEPGGVDGQLDQGGVGPALAEPVAGGLAAVARSVVDHPEHPAGRGVGLDAHDLVDQPAEGLDAGLGFAAAEDLGPVDVPGGQVLQGPAPLVLVLDPAWSRPGGGAEGGMGAHSGLDGGLLVGGDHVVARPSRLPCHSRA